MNLDLKRQKLEPDIDLQREGSSLPWPAHEVDELRLVQCAMRVKVEERPSESGIFDPLCPLRRRVGGALGDLHDG